MRPISIALERVVLMILTGAFLISAEATWAADCPSRDLNAPDNSPLRKMQVYDQDGSGICGAIVAAQLANYQLIAKGTSADKLVNPVFAAWLSRFEDMGLFSAKGTSGVGTKEVLQSLRKLGNCPSVLVSNSLEKLRRIGKMTDGQLLAFLEQLYDSQSIGDIFFARDPQAAIQSASRIVSSQAPEACNGDGLAAELKRAGLIHAAATKVLDSLFVECKGAARDKLDIPEPIEKYRGSDEAMITTVDHAIDSGRPAGVAVDMMFFEHPASVWISGPTTILPRCSSGTFAPMFQGHMVLATARHEFAEDGCMYLLRNSWGAHWQPKNRKCACIATDGSYQAVCKDPVVAQKLLGCWYKRTDLMRNVCVVTELAP